MSKQQVPTHTNKNHEGLIDFISSRHYNNQYKEELKAKLFSDKAMFNEALLEFRQEFYKDIPIEDFIIKYQAKYGSPFSEQQSKPEQQTSNATANLVPEQQVLQEEAATAPVASEVPGSLQPQWAGVEAPNPNVVPNQGIMPTGEQPQGTFDDTLGYIAPEAVVTKAQAEPEQGDNWFTKIDKAVTGLVQGNEVSDRIGSGMGSFTSGVGNFLISSPLKAAGELGYQLERNLPTTGGEDVKLEDNPLYKLGSYFEKELIPAVSYKNPKYQGDFATDVAPTTLGQAGAALLTAPKSLAQGGLQVIKQSPTLARATWEATKKLMVTPALFGAATAADAMHSEAYQEVEKVQKMSKEDYVASKLKQNPEANKKEIEANYDNLKAQDKGDVALKSYISALPSGMTDAIPVGKLFTRLDKILGGQIKNTIVQKGAEVGKQSVLGFIEESIQKSYENATAINLYDQSREVIEGVVEEGAAGGVAQGVLQAVLMGLIGRRAKASSPADVAIIDEAIAKVEGKQQEIESNIAEVAKVEYEVEPVKLADGRTGLRRKKNEMGEFILTDGTTEPSPIKKSRVVTEAKPTAGIESATTATGNTTVKSELEQQSAGITTSAALESEVTYQGRKGILKQDGQQVIVETDNLIFELGNIDDLRDKPIQQYGVEPVKADRSFVADGDYSVTVNGTRYLNRYSDPLAAVNYDKDGNAVSVNLETPEGKKRTFRGENAERIAYEYTLLDKAKNQPEKPAAVEQEVQQQLTEVEATTEQAPAVNQVQPTVEPEVIAETPVAEEKPKRSAPDPYKIPLYDEQAKNKTVPAKDVEAPAEPIIKAEPVKAPAATKEQAPAATETVQVGKSTYTVEKSGDGYVVTNTGTKKVVPQRAASYTKVIEEYEAKQSDFAEKETSLATQEKRNSFIDRVRSLNEIIRTGTKKQRTEAQASLSKLPREAEALGLELKRQINHNGKLLKTYDVTDKATGKKATIKNADTPTSTAANYVPLAERSKPVQDLAARVIKAAREDYRILQGLGLGISKESDIKGALADIEQGKPTNRAQKLLDVIEEAERTGIFDKTTQEGAGLVRRTGVPVDDLLGSEDGSSASTESPAAPAFGSKSIDDFILSENILNQDGSLNYETLQERLSSNQIGAMQWVYDLTDNDVQTLTDIVNERREQSTGTGEKAEANTGADSERSTGTGGANRGGQVENEANEGGRGHTKQAEHSVAASKFDQDRANIYEVREAIKSRIKEKSQGRLNALPVDLIPEYAALVKTYLQEGVVGVKEIVAKLKSDHSALFSSAEDLDSGDIASILKKGGIAPPEATGERKHTKRLLASPDLSEDFKNGITEQDKRYIPTTNELNGAEADAYIDFKGAELATKDALDLNNEMHPATRSLLRDKLIAYWDKLAIQSLNDGDEVTAELYFDKAETITSAKVERGTVLGQELQAYRFVAGSSPERVLYNTRKEVEKSKKKELKKVEPNLKKKTDAIRKVNQDTIAEALAKGNIVAAIRKAMREDGINIASVVRKHYTVADKTGKTLADKLVELSKLEETEAQKLADLIQKEFAAIATKKKQQLLFQILTPKERLNPKKKKQLHDRIIELSNLGALSDKDMADLYADKMGLPKLTPEQSAKIIELAEKVQEAKEGLPKNHAMQALIRYQEQIKGYVTSDLLRSIWYANVLSGYSTQMINAFANTNNTIGELYTSTVLRPKSLPFLLNGLMQGYARGRWEALNVIKTGESPIRGGKIAIPSALEGVTFKGGKWNPYNYLKYVQRIMEASDTLSYHGLREMRSFEMAYSKAKEAGISKPTKEIWNEVTEMLYATSERKAEAELKATDEDLKGRDYKRRVYELMEQSRPIKFIEDAHDFASLGTFNHQPLGTLGFLTDSISRITGNVKAASYIVPFTRIISNVANSYLDWSPYGILRATTGRTGNALSDTDANAKYRREFTPEERAKILIKSGTGILAAVALYALTAPGEDEKEAVIQISATGPVDFKKRQELAETGWQKYSIKIGNTWYSYQNTPLAIPLAAIGHVRDDERFNGKSLEDESFATKVGIQFLSTISFFSEMTFLKGVSEFLGALNGSNPDQAGSYIKRTAASIGKGFIIPNLFTQVSKEVQAIAEIPTKDAPTMLGKIVRDMPIARNNMNDMVNALGEPVYPDTDRITSTTKESPVWELIIEKQAWIGKPNKGSITMIDRDGREAGITDAEYYKLCKLRGQYIKRLIEENLPELQEMKKEEVQEVFTKWKTEATKFAKQEIYNSR